MAVGWWRLIGERRTDLLADARRIGDAEDQAARWDTLSPTS